MDTNTIQVIDDQGNEKEFDVLFTFDHEDKQYVLYYDSSLDEPEVFASIYDDEGNLFDVETPEEWDMIEEIFATFTAEEE